MKEGKRMIEFEKTIVHIIDCEHNTLITSTNSMDETQSEVEKMMQTKGMKVFANVKKKSGKLKAESVIIDWLDEYRDQSISFEELSIRLAKRVFDLKMRYAIYEQSDLIISEVLYEGRRYLFLLDNSYHEGITHHLKHEGEDIYNEVIPYRTLLSTNLTKGDRACMLELSDQTLCCVEHKTLIENEQVTFFGDLVMQSTTAPSYQEATSAMSKTTESLKEKYDLDDMDLMPKMKRILNENVDQQTPIDVDEVADLLFSHTPLAKDEFKAELKKQGIHKPIEVEYVKSSRAEKVQKIKTDKGIEIIIPVDYMNVKDLVEFQTQSDGTISIQLKNINHFTSK